MARAGWQTALVWCLMTATVPASAVGARRDKASIEEPAAWETPDGRDEARLAFARGLLDSGSPDACLELIAQLRRDGVKGIDLEKLHAEALRATGLDDDARAILEAVVKRWPRDAAAHNDLGILAMDREDVEGAVVQFEQAVRYDKENGQYLNNLGFALLVSERPDEAIDTLRMALRADSSKAQTRNNLGFALVAAGREQEALRVFKAAARDSADAHYNMGVGLELRGSGTEASEAYERALKADPDHQKARDALARLSGTGAPVPSDSVKPASLQSAPSPQRSEP
jgi:Tfp pilus assembly protein PilF